MKKIILLMFICIAQISFTLEVERIRGIDLGTVIERDQIHSRNASEIWVKGIPGKRVKMVVPDSYRENNKGVGIDINKIYLKKDELVLDGRGRGKFEMSIYARAKGSGKMRGEIPIEIEYIN